MVKRYLNVRYEDRDLAKRLGARWDPAVKRWYCPAGSPLAKIFQWRKDVQETPMSQLSSVPAVKKIHRAQNENFELPLAG